VSHNHRKAIIGTLTPTKDERWVVNRTGAIAQHIIVAHVERIGSRHEDWVSLYLEPETGLYWESHPTGPDYHGSAQTLLPISPEEVRRLYLQKPRRKAREGAKLEGSLIQSAGHPQGIIGKRVEGTTWEFDIPRIAERLENREELATPAELFSGAVIPKEYTDENKAARIARHLLDLHLVDTLAVRDQGTRRLYYHPRRQQYWELVYIESGKFGEGPPSLIPIPHGEVKGLYEIEPLPKTEKVRIAAESMEEDLEEGGEQAKDQVVRIISHLVNLHFVKTNLERSGGWIKLYRDPVDDSYYEVGRPEVVTKKGHKTIFGTATASTKLGPLTLVQISYIEITDLYGCIPMEGD